MSGEKKSIKDWFDWFDWLAYILIVIILMSGIYYVFIDFYFSKHELDCISREVESLGQLGDFFGGILNPVFAFLSFCILLLTIKIQTKALKTSQEELKLSREELSKSSEALIEQSKSLKLQNFETTFFNMINLHNQIVSNIKIKTHYIDYEYEKLEKTIKTKKLASWGQLQAIKSNFKLVKIEFIDDKIVYYARESIEKISENIDNFVKDRTKKNEIKDIYKIDNLNNYRKFPMLYNLCYECYKNVLGNYFANIYQILKFISTSKDINKRKYSDLFRAQFSSQELKLLFYHCYSIDSEGFKSFIEEFEFLENLSIEKENEIFKYIFFMNQIDVNKAFGIKNNKYISSITDLIKKQIDEIKVNEDVHNHLEFYKYFTEQEIKKFLPKLMEKECSKYSITIKELILKDYDIAYEGEYKIVEEYKEDKV